MKHRSIIYIDGFNFFYGAIKATPHKWLDLQRYFRMIRKHDDIQRIYYFTALVQGSHQPEQQVYLQALDTLPLVSIVLGKFKMKQFTCLVPGCTYAGRKRFNRPEEKRTDVNIAVQMLDDAYRDTCDTFVLVTGDSDLVPAVARIKQRRPDKQVVVYIPARDPARTDAVELRSVADRHRNLPLNLLKHAHLPARMPDGAGGFIAKPPSW